MNLTHLSLQRAPRLHKQMPHAPSNEQRLREFRKVAPVERHNGFRWPFHGSQPVGIPAESPNAPAGCLPDPPEFDDFMDAGGNALDYASLSRGW